MKNVVAFRRTPWTEISGYVLVLIILNFTVPHGPKMVSGSAVSSNALNASWTPMDFSLYTGVTNFTLEAKDTVDSSIVRRCTTSGKSFFYKLLSC